MVRRTEARRHSTGVLAGASIRPTPIGQRFTVLSQSLPGAFNGASHPPSIVRPDCPPGFLERTMTLLQMLLDGALAAAELLVLLFVPPAIATEPAVGRAPLERPLQWHRLSTSVDVRLLGALADVRITQRLRNDSDVTADLAPELPAAGDAVDALRVIRAGHAVDLLRGDDCIDDDGTGRARVSTDEAIADALRVAPGADALIEAVRAAPLAGGGRLYRVGLPAPLQASEPIASLVQQDDVSFLVVVTHRAATAATVRLRPGGQPSEAIALGSVDPGVALLVPLGSGTDLEALANGAIELELVDGAWRMWTTLAATRTDLRRAVQAQAAD
jgi:hypothetical protein